MKLALPCLLFLLLATTLARAADLPARTSVQVARASQGMVVSETPHASRVGRDVLTRGGNAVDAAVATAFALAVTWPEAGNIGGGGFMMVHPADGKPPVCVEYRETAPAAATETMFELGESRYNCKAVGVPGTVGGLQLAHESFGRLPWRDIVMPAVRLAESGFVVDDWLAYSTNKVLEQENVRLGDRYAELRRVYSHPQGRPWRKGDVMVLLDLARTLRTIAERGGNAFYEGRIADLLVAEMQRGNGIISKQDLEGYRAKIRKPIGGTYRGYDLYGPPPPCSGGTCVIETLNILEPFKLREHPRFGARNLHLIAEAARRAFADRAKYLGDPDFTSIPKHLTGKEYAAKLAGAIKLDEATPSEAIAPEIQLADESPDTTHFSVIDGDGMGVSNTYTLEASWGSRIVVPGAGFLLNNEMGDFNWKRGHTDRKGRIGTDANLIRPGKRMLSSQSPFIVARDGKVVLLTGSPGGRTIINTVLGNILNVLEFEMPIDKAIDTARLHHQWFPDEITFEGTKSDEHASAVKKLRDWGHTVRYRSRQGSAHSIHVDLKTSKYVGVADWRRGGFAAGHSQ
ncbi:MAG: gamma-glutamyltransferase [Planctomycetaceae bacterium]|nr:gamma-glutamyltransferase [Planctomycetaceae bacterium]